MHQTWTFIYREFRRYAQGTGPHGAFVRFCADLQPRYLAACFYAYGAAPAAQPLEEPRQLNLVLSIPRNPAGMDSWRPAAS